MASAVVLVTVLLLVLAVVQLGVVPPLTATTVIQVRNGTLTVTRDQVSASTIEHIRSILRDEGVTAGFIAVTATRVYFSYQIPQAAHQRLRNVLLNRFR